MEEINKILEFAKCGIYHNWTGEKREEYLKMLERVKKQIGHKVLQ